MEFVNNNFLGAPAWFWLAFLSLVVVLLAFDLGILNKHDRELGVAESLKLSVFYIAMALALGVWVWWSMGAESGMERFTGYAIERALSTDNVFVISLIFSYFAIPAISLGMTVALLAGGVGYSLWRSRAGRPQSAG